MPEPRHRSGGGGVSVSGQKIWTSDQYVLILVKLEEINLHPEPY